MPVPRIAHRRTTQPNGTHTHPIGFIAKENDMLRYAIVFFIIALVAGFLGFFSIAGTTAWIAKVLFILFLVLFAISLISGRRPRV
jgi:uncharacterized membrane protein YtjA (UPF0391 family)